MVSLKSVNSNGVDVDIDGGAGGGVGASPPRSSTTTPSSPYTAINRTVVSFIKDVIFDRFLYPVEDDATNGNGNSSNGNNNNNDNNNNNISISNYARFHALEKIARVPYFAYCVVEHFRDTVGAAANGGAAAAADSKQKVFFEESYNELIHLTIMAELGGARNNIKDTIISSVLSVTYFIISLLLYLINPQYALNLNSVVEEHAVETYDAFLDKYGESVLKYLPPTKTAKLYYGDLHGHDKVKNLYDVFVFIRNDEREHCEVMNNMLRDIEIEREEERRNIGMG
jgi:ubiquinol oxidase